MSERHYLYQTAEETPVVDTSPIVVSGDFCGIYSKEGQAVEDEMTFTSTVEDADFCTTKTVSVRCRDGAEMATLMRHQWRHGSVDYELNFEDAYCGGDYRGIWGRLKRAWRALCDKPICYTGLYFEGTPCIKKFLTDCLALVEEGAE